MKKSQQFKATIELNRHGVFLITNTSKGQIQRKRFARSIRLRAFGRAEDGVTVAQVRFRTRHGQSLRQSFPGSSLLPENTKIIKNALADLGYEWPSDEELCKAIFDALRESRPKRTFHLVRAPGWYGSVFAIPGQAFEPGGNHTEVHLDPKSDAHVGAFVAGEGSLKDWQDRVAKPSRKSSRLRLSIAAALAAPFLRKLGMDSFGLNWFSETSDGKTLCLIVAASVAGLVGTDGLPCWADTEAGIEAIARGHRDNVMPLDESADGEHQMPLEKKAQMVAFLIARGRPRKLSPVYERNHNLTNREFRIIPLSSSERALRDIARAAQRRRLGGEEVRFIDIPASEPGSSGIFDEDIVLEPGKNRRETVKDFVETMRADAIEFQGHAIRALMQRYVKDPKGLDTLKGYKQRFERKAAIADQHNAYYRVRSNFALTYAAAALGIDYGILPWGKRATFRAVEKCMRLALETLETGKTQAALTPPSVDLRRFAKTLKSHLACATILPVTPKQKVTTEQARARRKADGFKINGGFYVKPDRFKSWIPSQSDRDALKAQGIIITDRRDTSTVDKKIGGIEGKPRYYAIDVRALHRLASRRA
jgi:putative DNA primase/helicase